MSAVLSPSVADPSSKQNKIDFVSQLFVPNPGQNKVLVELLKLLEAPNNTRPVNLALIAAPNFGKSETLRHFEAKTNPEYDYSAERTDVPVVRIEMTNVTDPGALLRSCLARLEIRHSIRDPVDELWRRLKIYIEPLKIRAFLFDDAHNAAQLRVGKQRELLQTLRGFGGMTGRPIVLAGTDYLSAFLENDLQFRTRFIPLSIPALASKMELQRFLKGFDERLQLPKPSNLADPATVALVYDLVGLDIGAVCQVVKSAAHVAIRSDAANIDSEMLRSAATSVPGLYWREK